MRIRRKILPAILLLVLVIGFCPATAFAASSSMLNFSQPNINAVGKQSKNSCACLGFAYAYGQTMTTGKIHYWTEYDLNGGKSQANFSGKNVASFPKSTAGSVQSALRMCYDAINNRRPVVLYVNQRGGGQHWVLVVGYKNVSNPNNLDASQFLMLDPVYGSAQMPEALNCRGYTVRLGAGNVRICNAQTPVSATPTAKAPTIKPYDVLGGKKIQLVDNQGGATIRYTLDGKTNPTASSGTLYNGTWINNTWATMGVRAIAAKSGMNTSAVVGLTSYTGLTAAPRVNQTHTASGTTIELKSDTKAATIFYTLDGTTPTFDMQSGTSNAKKYTGAFSLTKNCTVKAIAVASGMRVSSAMSESITCVPPAVPTPAIQAAKIAQGDTVKVTWDRDASAASYTATLYKDGQTVDTQVTTAPEAVFVLSDPGQYSVGVKAANAIGESSESALLAVEAVAPLTVRFMSIYTDEDGEQISRVDNEQTVKYGSDAVKPADPPRRRGYTFAGWDGQDKSIKQNTDIVATWRINEYKVKFYAADGRTVLSQQDVQYGCAATAPDAGTPPTGKVFSGWAVTDADDDSVRDFTKVDSNLSLRAVFAWADEELPVVAEITKAERTASGNYTVCVRLTNHPSDVTTALLRVALKTSNDKLVQTSRETIEIGTDGVIEKEVVLKYNGDNVATVAEVEVVALDGNYRTGGACSKAVQSEIVSMDNFYFTDWSEWSTEEPQASDTVEVEEAVQYRSREKRYTKSTATTLAGWDRVGDPETTYGGWGSTQTTTSKPAASDTLQITGQSTKYTYYRWCNYYDNCQNQDSIAYGKNCTYHEVTLSSPMTACANKFADKGGKAWDLHGPYGSCAHRKTGVSYWWTKSIVTTYSYQTRSKTVTYEYSQWGDWSEWGFGEAIANADREVESQKVYRFRTKQPGAIQGSEDTTGTKQSVSGTLATGTDLSGKEATVMVYNVTNSDPNEDQVQYIGQTTIGAGNTYSFAFIPRQDPSVESGDFIVALGVKGSTGLVNVATIPAPRAQYTVRYQYEKADGSIAVISEQKVNAGEDAVAPAAPSREGCQFLGWSRAASGVDRDMVVNALFSERTCTVAWVDHEAEDVLLQTVPYGSLLVAPADRAEVEGYSFKGWDALMKGAARATGDMVIKAVYEPETHMVMFVNHDGSVFKTEQVEHGKAAALPDTDPVAPGMEFVGWGTTSQTPWWCVTEDLVVKPLFAYEGTVSSPYSSVELASGYVGANGAKVYLEAPTEGSVIYYTVDGSDPVAPKTATTASVLSFDAEEDLPSEGDLDKEAGVSYAYDPNEGITVTKPVTIRAMACASGMNDSSISEIPVEITSTNDISKAEAYLASAPYYYGEPVEPGIMVSFGDDLLVYGEDYTIAYANNKAVGKARATIAGKGAYTGQRTLEFDITAPPAEGEDASDKGSDSSSSSASGSGSSSNVGTTSNSSASSAPVSISKASVSASFVKKNAKPTVTVKVGRTALKAGVDYTVSCGKAKKVGAKVKVVIRGKGAYTGSKTVTVKVGKGANPMTAKAAKKVQVVKFAKAKKKAQVIGRPLTVKSAAGKVSYKNASKGKALKKFKVNAKTGKITVPKGTKKGVYAVKVKVTAKGNASYKAASKTVTVKVRVK